MLDQAIAIANGKGGVGKSSLVANMAAIAAKSNWHVLIVDLDPQGNLGSDLGYKQRGESDDGAALSQAIQFGTALEPVRAVRDNLDAVPAGRHTRSLAGVLLQEWRDKQAETHSALVRVLEPITNDYDLILFDCPPGDTVLGDMALTASRGLLVPVKFDGGSLDGLELMARRFAEIKGGGVNPTLELLGIALFDFNLQATAMRSQVVAELAAAFGEDAPVFETAIRHSQRAAFDMRRDGLVAIEYEQRADEDRVERLSLLRRGVDHLRRAGPAKSQSAHGLADDYMALTHEVLESFGAIGPNDGTPVEAEQADPWGEPVEEVYA